MVLSEGDECKGEKRVETLLTGGKRELELLLLFGVLFMIIKVFRGAERRLLVGRGAGRARQVGKHALKGGHSTLHSTKAAFELDEFG